MKVVNNERRPTQPGIYQVIDTHEFVSFQYFNGNYWTSTTGHPVEFWFDDFYEEPTEQQLDQYYRQSKINPY